MKNCISIILTAAMTLTLAACTAAPDPAPIATPTPEPTAAPAAPTPAPAAADFYTLRSYNGSYDDGTAYYEFVQRLGCTLLPCESHSRTDAGRCRDGLRTSTQRTQIKDQKNLECRNSLLIRSDSNGSPGQLSSSTI